MLSGHLGFLLMCAKAMEMKTTIMKSSAAWVEVAKRTTENSEAAEMCEGVICALIEIFRHNTLWEEKCKL